MKGKVYLAPMAGVTDAAFRHIAIEQGADFTYTEMVSAKGLKYGSAKTASLLTYAENEKEFGVQLFASDVDALKSSIEALMEYYAERIALFDINMGCPAPKITNNGEGSALMKNPELASSLIKAAVGISSKPVTVKFRKGWDETSINAVDFARMAEQSGAAAVAVHGRTRQQFYSGNADLDIIAKVKKAVSIPVIGNGDIFCAQDALNMMDATGCDAVMVARGALGNPFIFREIKSLIQNGKQTEPASPQEKMQALIKQAELACRAKGERTAMRQIRKHAAWYFKGLRGAAKLREAAVHIETLDDLYVLLRSAENLWLMPL
jgi:tRNA-dihydrouridine synthase B